MNETQTAPFSGSRQDVSDLQKTAVDAAKDLHSTASAHVEKAKGQLSDLASHAQQEGQEQLDQAKIKLTDLSTAVRDYIAERPLASLGTALAIGFFLGLSRRSA